MTARRKPAVAGPDAKLFTLIKELATLQREAGRAWRKMVRLHAALQRHPDYPGDGNIAPASNPAGWRRFKELAEETGYRKAANDSNAADRGQGKAMRALMRCPATTVLGAAAKLRATLETGSGMPHGQDQQENLPHWNDTGYPWAAAVAADLEAIARRSGARRRA